jgi:hypothetical protein
MLTPCAIFTAITLLKTAPCGIATSRKGTIMAQTDHATPAALRRPRADVLTWACAIVSASRRECSALIAQIPTSEREVRGALGAWSTKDEIAHLAYWIELFATNIAAARAGQPLVDTRSYLAMNDVAWHERKDWDWVTVEQALLGAIDAVEAQLAALSADELTDGGLLTVEPVRRPPRPLIRNLLYELIDHPLHHATGIYRGRDATAACAEMLARVTAVVDQPGVRTLAAATRAKLRGYSLE